MQLCSKQCRLGSLSQATKFVRIAGSIFPLTSPSQTKAACKSPSSIQRQPSSAGTSRGISEVSLNDGKNLTYQARAAGSVRKYASFDGVHEAAFGNIGDIPEDTIVALSSGSGRSAVAVIRLSGPRSDEALLAILRPGSSLPDPRVASLRNLYDPESGQLLDKALALRFPGPASFTGEDVVELQGHGGPAVVRSLLMALTALPGIRLAQAGEFTRQAFMGGKLDLTEVEGIADLLAAETAAQHRQALQQTSGVQRKQYEAWRKSLLRCLAHVEAVIDFGDDNDIQSGVAREILPLATALRKELEGHLKEGRRGELLRDGLKVALIGPPNAGKSTLLNRLAGREAAIVSAIPGTTRDALEVILELGGHKVVVTDTAGLRETRDVIEAEGVSRAKQAASNADIVIAVADVGAPDFDDTLLQWTDLLNPGPRAEIDSASKAPEGGFKAASEPAWSTGWVSESQEPQEVQVEAPSERPANLVDARGKPVILVFNKWDLLSQLPFQLPVAGSRTDSNSASSSQPDSFAQEWLEQRFGTGNPEIRNSRSQAGNASVPQPKGISTVIGISASTGAGVDLLLQAVQQEITNAVGSLNQREGYMITRLRHRGHVEECIQALRGYESVYDELELASEELRYAARALGKVTGAIDIEHILDAIFSEFCVGK